MRDVPEVAQSGKGRAEIRVSAPGVSSCPDQMATILSFLTGWTPGPTATLVPVRSLNNPEL